MKDSDKKRTETRLGVLEKVVKVAKEWGRCVAKRWFARLFTGWCVAAVVELLHNPYGFATLEFMDGVIMWRFVTVAVYVMLLLTAISYRRHTVALEAWILLLTAFAYLLALALRDTGKWLCIGLAAVYICVMWYLVPNDRLSLRSIPLSRRTALWLIALAATVFATFCITVTVCRYRGYVSSTWDFGVFTQMFHYMKETGLPLTTCERGELLSHFAVHLSPVWYLFLPLYWMFPFPETLQILQALTLVSGVVPLYLLCRHKGLSVKAQCAVCLCYFSFPALIGGQMYDVHENLFLTPFLLWLLYFYEKRRWVAMALFALLTCLVKEDAPLFTGAIALFIISDRRDYKRGVPLFLGSVLYFVGAVTWLQIYGEGAMTASRFSHFLPNGEEGLHAVLRTVITNPGYLFLQVFTAEKILFLLFLLLPLAGMPLLSKRVSHLPLLIPILVENVMPSWPYQYSLHYQYVFGAIALLFYLAVMNLPSLTARWRRFLLPTMCGLSILITVSQMSSHFHVVLGCIENAADNQRIAAVLAEIPQEASVVSHGYLLPSVGAREQVYDMTSQKPAEYIVLDLRPGREEDAAEKDAEYSGSTRFVCVARYEGLVVVFRDTEYANIS